MPFIAMNCLHIDSQGDLSIIKNVIAHKETFDKCFDCDYKSSNLWLCLYSECRYVGCDKHHHEIHNRELPLHSAYMNLSTNKIWCYFCGREIHTMYMPSPPQSPNMNDHKTFGNKFSGDASGNMDSNTENYDSHRQCIKKFIDDSNMVNRIHGERGDPFLDKSEDLPDSTDSDDVRDFSGRPSGLVGLQNIGNTCYMNSALQALSNVPPLTQFFINCGHMVTYLSRNRKPPLSLSYLHLISEMWSKGTRGFIGPHDVLNGIRTVYPMFRGYHQHDTQEFLRCFMDQLHEELKENREEDRENLLRMKTSDEASSDDDETEVDGAGSSQSDAEYETCDSGVSEQSSLSDDGERGTKRRYSKVSQADKPISKSSNRGVKKGTAEPTYSQSSPAKHRTKKPTKTRSIISDIFDGKLLSSVQCLTCDRISTRIETFQDLSLPIPSKDHIDMLCQGSLTPQKSGPCSNVVYVTNQPSWFSWIIQWISSWFWPPVVSLDDCLSAFFSTDELKGDNMYSCEKCNKLRNGTKFSKVLELPEVLCIHLKRFRHELMFSSKIASYVSFPLDELDMRVHLHEDCVSKVTTYGLISVICHHGTAGGGHYVCYALNSSTNQWFEFDDQRVTPVKPEDVKNCGAYVLFYKKTSQDMMQLREEIVELMDTPSKEASDLNFFISTQWINRFNTFAEPGPIDNSEFLCQHGGVDPARSKFIKKISRPIERPIWEFLFKKFSGGPVCTQLYECSICEEKYEALEKRRLHELEMYNILNIPDNPTAFYALSTTWFRQWQSFVKSKETQPPGAIDNNSIVVNKSGQAVLKIDSDYSLVIEEHWQFFVKTYGGGPEVILHSCQRQVPPHTTIPIHSTTNATLVEQNIKFNHLDAKSKQESLLHLHRPSGLGEYVPRASKKMRCSSYIDE
ncbi:PREDICTED: ubiquitin carboxyl-terminal hydrolase 20 [Ceratosolen solmsi marchali]|uniref:Ubiquitin carboxyl-terminal hydrolase n=1 Tax=Ceratosolen solmsi marchali TaxID=326594 RepID=A0AAJ6YX81_9HYME|nr:PREDICTED: ubiquitin carboxyl-terminal hydrolase 20 [Ceratosolen solmsi marchali]